MAQHLLHASQIGATFEEVGGEGVAQQVRVHTLRLESRAAGEASQDQERARARERAALWPASIATLVMGVAPVLWLNIIDPAVHSVLAPLAQTTAQVVR